MAQSNSVLKANVFSVRKALRCLFVFLVICSIFLPYNSKTYADSAASDITSKCIFFVDKSKSLFKYATDGRYETAWNGCSIRGINIDINISSEDNIGGIYLVWRTAPKKWVLKGFDNIGHRTKIISESCDRYLTQFISVSDSSSAYRKLILTLTPDLLTTAELAEIRVYGPGKAPYYAPSWKPFSGRADILTIATHPDDEDLYLGVPAVIYGDQGMKCQTVFMTYGSSKSIRRYEAQESVWSLGNKSYPVMGSFRDKKTYSLREALRYWPLHDTVGFIVEQIRKYKPSVIVTHDVNGEYGHGAHMLTEYSTLLAFKYAGDPNKYPESVSKYGTWNAGKLYIHLYTKNALHTLYLDKHLITFDNKTVLQVISNAYLRQKSQLPGRSLPVSGNYDMRKFGLAVSNVGPDFYHNSMFENISDDMMHTLNPGYTGFSN